MVDVAANKTSADEVGEGPRNSTDHFVLGFFNNVFIFSPTIESDPKFALLLRTRGVRSENIWLKRWLRKQKEKEDREKNRVLNKHCPYCCDLLGRPFCACDSDDEDETIPGGQKKFDSRIPKENVYTSFSDAVIQKIQHNQREIVQYLEDHGRADEAPKRIDRVLLIFDDPVGSSLFSAAKESVFKTLNTVSY